MSWWRVILEGYWEVVRDLGELEEILWYLVLLDDRTMLNRIKIIGYSNEVVIGYMYIEGL